ncbi:MAG: ABC transporter ATP-binding protein [Roseiflexus sp.]|uniref:ABC transporter ATP-binding protein n=1 Tax=Roseiflexus sp. TaxID=2562120 RepID=UPI0025EA3C2F|nr:ABC transporter ATP-binding protein [Roseiflexus sp.]MCL6543298.1 ABC transporter ATP-binding protein [Roseiflexus sp.]
MLMPHSSEYPVTPAGPETNHVPVIQVYGLTKSYGSTVVVDHVNLTVYQGDIYGLLGPNGAGKTTLIALLLGLIRPSAGEWHICNHDPRRNLQAALRHVGAMIEAPAFYPHLTGAENLHVLGGIRGPLPSGKIDDVLRQVGLQDRGRDRYRTYSLGMKQRLAIGLALVHDPAILILDEPTNGIDPQGRVEIRELLRTLSQAGKTIVLCSHLLAEVEQICTRAAILRRGRVVIESNVRDLVGQGNLELTFLELTKEVS